MNSDKIRKNFLSVEETDSRCELVLRLILKECRPISVVIFGSAARYELTSSSDIDVVVVLKEASDIKKNLKSLYTKSAELPFSVDFLLVDEKSYSIKSQIGGVFFDAFHKGKILL